MKVVENEKQSWEYAFLGYCRENGLSHKYGKVAAQTLERSVFVGIDNDKDEENNREFLLNTEVVEEFKESERDTPAPSELIVELLTEGLNILPERALWLLKNCSFSLKTK
jgi:hypothetical protein